MMLVARLAEGERHVRLHGGRRALPPGPSAQLAPHGADRVGRRGDHPIEAWCGGGHALQPLGDVGPLGSPEPRRAKPGPTGPSAGVVPGSSPRDDSQWWAGRRTRHASVHGNARRRPDDAARRHPGRRPRPDDPRHRAGADPSEAPTTAGDAPTGGAADSPPDPGPRRLYKSRDDRMIARRLRRHRRVLRHRRRHRAHHRRRPRVRRRRRPARLRSPRGCSCPSGRAGPRDRPAAAPRRSPARSRSCSRSGRCCPFTAARSAAGMGRPLRVARLPRAGGARDLVPGFRVSIPPVGGVRDVLRRAGFGLALLAVCGILALAGAWATAAGGGVVVAAVVIVAGLVARRRRLPRRRALADPPRARARAAGRRRVGRERRHRRRRRRPPVPPVDGGPGARHATASASATSSSTCATRSCPPATAACTSTSASASRRSSSRATSA